VVDPDDHHLFVSLGCAAENVVHAAAAVGLRVATPAFEANAVSVRLEPARPVRSPLLEAIPLRQCTRAAYDGRPVATESLRLLEQAGTADGVSALVITDRAQISQLADYVVEGTSAQMRDKAFMNELRTWLRFNEQEAVASMDGLFAGTSGNRSLPGWLARLLL